MGVPHFSTYIKVINYNIDFSSRASGIWDSNYYLRCLHMPLFFFFPLSCLLAGYVSLRFLGTLCMCSLLALLPQLLKHFKAFTCIIIFGAMNSVELRLLFFRGWIYFVYYMLGYYRKCVHLAPGFVKMKALYFWPFRCIC